jgi:hypothetical protein
VPVDQLPTWIVGGYGEIEESAFDKQGRDTTADQPPRNDDDLDFEKADGVQQLDALSSLSGYKGPQDFKYAIPHDPGDDVIPDPDPEAPAAPPPPEF